MKAHLTFRFILFALLLIFAAAAPSFAHTVRSRELCGTIASIDASNRTLEVRAERSGKIVNLVLPPRALVLLDWKRAGSAALAGSSRACVFYRSPLFGKPFVSKVILLNDQDACPPLREGGLLQHN